MSRFVRRDSGRPITAAGSGGNDSDSGSASGVVMDAAADAAAETSSSDLRLDCESLPLRGATPAQVTTVLNHGTLPYVAIVEITHGSDTQEQEKEQVSTHAHQGGGGIGGEVVLVGVIGRADLHTLAAQQQHAPLPRQQQAAASTGDGPSSFNDVEVGDQCAEEEQDGGDAAAIAGGGCRRAGWRGTAAAQPRSGRYEPQASRAPGTRVGDYCCCCCCYCYSHRRRQRR